MLIFNKEKVKPCKLCASSRYGNSSWCAKHYTLREWKKKDAKKLKSKKVTKKEEKSLKKRLQARCWKLQSELVRRRGANFQGNVACYTCGRIIHWKDAQCGHYQHGKLDFDERNLKVQDVHCNLYKSGALDSYTLNLIRDYGEDWVRQLKNDAAKHIGYSVEELQAIELDLKKKLSTLPT